MKRRHPEDAIQRAIVAHYRKRAVPGTFIFAVPNGGYRRPVQATILKATGTVAGVPDTIWIKGGLVYGLELKAPGGRATEAQLTTIEQMDAAGALVVLESWGLLRTARARAITAVPGS
jgi:hypothetical protein